MNGRVNVEKYPGWQQKEKYESINQMLNISNITSRDVREKGKPSKTVSQNKSTIQPSPFSPLNIALPSQFLIQLFLSPSKCVHWLSLSLFTQGLLVRLTEGITPCYRPSDDKTGKLHLPKSNPVFGKVSSELQIPCLTVEAKIAKVKRLGFVMSKLCY